MADTICGNACWSALDFKDLSENGHETQVLQRDVSPAVQEA
jgi:hypothetical protein